MIDRLKTGWTLEQIAGRLGYDGQPIRVSHETIYAYVSVVRVFGPVGGLI
nr:hypothetical protein [Shimia aestuarii]